MKSAALLKQLLVPACLTFVASAQGQNLVVAGGPGGNPNQSITSGTSSWSDVRIRYDGTLTQSGGVASTGFLGVGDGGYDGGSSGNLVQGTYNLSSGTMTTGDLRIGYSGLSVPPTFYLPSEGHVNVSGGLLTINGTLSLGASRGHGELIQSGGVVIAQTVVMSTTADSVNRGTISLNGGVFQANAFYKGTSNNNTMGTTDLYFDGGTLRAGASSTNFINSNIGVRVRAGGATIDTNGYDINLPSLSHESGEPDGGLTKIGSGTLSFTNQTSNSYNGATSIKQGVLSISALGQLGSSTSALNLTGGGVLQVRGTGVGDLGSHVLNGSTFNGGFDVMDSSQRLTVAADLSGAGTLAKYGLGTLTLTGSSSLASVSVTSGTLQIGDGGAAGSFSGNILNNAALDFNRTGTVAYGGLVSGTGSLTKSGSGTLRLTGTTTHTGGTMIREGALELGDGGAIAGAIVDNGSLVFNRTGSTSFGNLISGTGTLVKNGGGVVVLTATNAYTGGTIINSGTLVAGFNGQSIGTFAGGSTVTVNSGGVLLGTLTDSLGYYQGNAKLVLNGGAMTLDGVSGQHTTLQDVTMIGGILTSPALGEYFLNGPLATLASSTTSVISSQIMSLGNGWTSGTFSGGAASFTVASGSTSSGIDLDVSARLVGAGSLTKNGNGTMRLTNAASDYNGVTTLNGGILGVSYLANGGSASNIGNSSSAASNLVFNGGTLAYTGTTVTTNRSFTLDEFNGGGIDVSNASATLTFTGSISRSGGSGSPILTKTGAGALEIGGTTDNVSIGLKAVGGTLLLAKASTGSIHAVGAPEGILVAGGTVRLGGTGGDQIYDGSGVTMQSGAFDMNGRNETIAFLGGQGGVLTNSSGSASTLTVNTGTATTFGGTLAGGSGLLSLVKSGTGTLTLSGLNTYTGVTTINAGILSASTLANGGLASSLGSASNAAANLVFNGGTLAYTGASVSMDRAITVNISSGAGINVANAATTLTLTGEVVRSTSNGSTTIRKTGAGTFELAGTTDNMFTRVEVLDGTVVLAKASNAGVHAVGAGEGVLLTSGSLRLAGTGGDQIFNGSGVTVNGGTFDMNGRNETIGFLSGAGGRVTNTSTVASALSIANSGSNGYSGALTDGAGKLSLVKAGAGALTLSGSSSYSGGTIVQSGTMIAGSNQAMGTGTVEVDGGVFVVETGVSIGNEVRLSGGVYSRTLSGNLAGMLDATSDLGGTNTRASILAGNTAGTTITTSFSGTALALNDAVRRSDVYSFAGTDDDIFVLQLSVSSTDSNTFLGWLEGNQWVNAIDGNTGNNATLGMLGYEGSFAQFQSEYGSGLSSYVGAFGSVTSGGVTSVWAVLDHNSQFAVVPEPATAGLLIGAAVLFFRRRRP